MNLPELQVSAGILQDASGRVLITQRPQGKELAGAWEFPGGKRATGETRLACLARELREELGIEVIVARHLIRYHHDYSDKRVHLSVWKVLVWAGSPAGIEKQPLRWIAAKDLMGAGLLPADEMIACALLMESAVNQQSWEPALENSQFVAHQQTVSSNSTS